MTPYTKRALHPYFHLRDNHEVRPYDDSQAVPLIPPGSWLTPQICDRYGLPNDIMGDGVIGIYEAGGGWIANDIKANCQLMGIPEPSITDISIDATGNDGDPTDPASGEVMLDIVGAAGVFSTLTGGKPATIRIYWSQSFSAAIARAASDGCRVLSFSWGASQAIWKMGGIGESLDDVDTAAKLALDNHGMVCLAAAGDNDADDGGGTLAVDGPACCENFIACGGTSLTSNSETVWNNNPGNPSGEGTGGGYADNSGGDFPMPSWQVGVVPEAPQPSMGRMVPDVAWNADPNTGCALVIGGQLTVVGGTSFAAPCWAGLIAASSTGKLPLLTPLFFVDPLNFNTQIDGNNGVYIQPPCPGPCTGMGSPKAGVCGLITSAVVK